MAGTEGGLVDGLYQLNDIPSALLKYDKDKDYAGMVVYIQREIAQFTYLLREKFPRQKVESHEPTLPEVTERSYTFSLATSATSHSSGVMTEVWAFSDEDAKNFQRNDFLHINGVFYDGAGNWTATFSPTSGTAEEVRIVEVGEAGSAASGKTNVTVSRGWGGDATGTPADVTTAMTVVLLTSAVAEGSRSRKSVGKNLVTGLNYVQKFREPYEASDFELEEDLFFNERPEVINSNLASMLLMKKIEFSFIGGRKNKVTDSATGRTLYTTGGVMEFIPNDADHKIDFGAPITPVGFNGVLSDIAKNGGGEERLVLGGYSAITAFNNAFDNKIELDQAMSDRYNLKIQQFDSSVGLRCKMVASFAMSQLGHDWDFLVLDLGKPETPYFQYMHIDDIFINAGRDGKGIQANDEFIRKEEYVGSIGLIRRASQYQHMIYNITQQL